MPVIFQCPDCGKKISAGDERAGLPVKCRHCGAQLRVPGDPLKPRLASPPKHASPAPRAALFVVIGLIIGLAGSFGAIWWFVRPTSAKPQAVAESPVVPVPIVRVLPAVAAAEKEKAIAPVAASAPGPKAPDLVPLLEALLAEVQAKGTAERITDFQTPGVWVRRRYTASNLAFDVQPTTSLVSPYVATVTWQVTPHISGGFATKDNAKHAELTATPPGRLSTPWKATLAFQRGSWVLKDLGWHSAALGLGKSYATRANDRDPVVDWWVAFGGEPPAGYSSP